MERMVGRREVLAAIMGAIVAGAPARARAGEVGVQETCGWYRAQGPVCRSGVLKEYWCERCCDPYGCQVIRCEWRVVGTC